MAFLALSFILGAFTALWVIIPMQRAREVKAMTTKLEERYFRHD